MNRPNETVHKTDMNIQGQHPKISILTITEIAAALIAFLLITVILWPGLIHLREYRHRIRCAKNLTGLGKAMVIYACDYDDKYPTSAKCCDLLSKYAEVSEKEFICPSAEKGRCHYAMNPNADLLKHPNMVVLFETKGGWNQFGGPELFSAENHKGDGGNILFNDGHVEFVKTGQLAKLKWKVDENNK